MQLLVPHVVPSSLTYDEMRLSFYSLSRELSHHVYFYSRSKIIHQPIQCCAEIHEDMRRLYSIEKCRKRFPAGDFKP